uniref:Uncharacterized protein n=2 Tax=Oryza TaxID=4527 RepID=A0A0E0NA16_ORYRU
MIYKVQMSTLSRSSLSFDGNPKLCGPVLGNDCDDSVEAASSQPSLKKNPASKSHCSDCLWRVLWNRGAKKFGTKLGLVNGVIVTMDREGRTYGPSSTAINKAGTIISIRKSVCKFICDILFFRTGYRDIFDIVVALVCWSIWKERNARIFEHRMRTPEHLVDDVKEETLVWKTAGVIKPCNNENH